MGTLRQADHRIDWNWAHRSHHFKVPTTLPYPGALAARNIRVPESCANEGQFAAESATKCNKQIEKDRKGNFIFFSYFSPVPSTSLISFVFPGSPWGHYSKRANIATDVGKSRSTSPTLKLFRVRNRRKLATTWPSGGSKKGDIYLWYKGIEASKILKACMIDSIMIDYIVCKRLGATVSASIYDFQALVRSMLCDVGSFNWVSKVFDTTPQRHWSHQNGWAAPFGD